ncbi:hypothetical protein I4U23_014140 [Adineta vaga]|nr:hypothetical protein I4U23_014140 [Adineta vaga]
MHFVSYKQRHCTDVFCLILFISFLFAYISVSILAISQGNPRNLVHPSDSFGNLCGQEQFQSRPYQFYYDISKCLTDHSLSLTCPTIKLCVQSCPTYYSHFQLLQTDENNDHSSKNDIRQQLICMYDFNPIKDNRSIIEIVHNDLCAPYTVPSEVFLGRCLPSVLTHLFDDQNNQTLKKNFSLKQMTGISRIIASDLDRIKESLALFTLIGCLLIILYMFVLKKLTNLIVFLTIMIFLSLLFLCSLFSWYTIYTGQDLIYEYSVIARIINDFIELKIIYYILGCLTTFLFIFSIIVILVSFNRLRLSIILLEQSTNAIFSISSTLFCSPLIFLLFSLLTLGILYIQMCFSTIGKAIPCSPKTNSTGCFFQQEYGYDLYTDRFTRTIIKFLTDNKTYLKWLNVFAYVWFGSFLFAFKEMILAGVFANYYWSKQHLTTSYPVFYSMIITIRYHLGSIAFGSLVITLFKHLRMILDYIHRKLSKIQGCILFTCFFWLFEKFLKFLNTNSYILIAMHGYSFPKATRQAFVYISTNCFRFFVLMNLTKWILFCGKISICIFNTYLFYQYLQWTNEFNHLILHWTPLMAIGLLTYLICCIFFNVYTMAIKTFFLCFLEDFNENDGSISSSSVMNNEFLRLVHKTKNCH